MKALILSVAAWVAFLAYLLLDLPSSTWAKVLRIVLSGLIGWLLASLIGEAIKTLL